MSTTSDTLLKWSQEGRLQSAQLSADGDTLTLDGTVLKNEKLDIEHSGKQCSYSLASIYLQILDPDQAIMAYRNQCKKYNVKDPIRPLEKTAVVGFFGAKSSSGATAAASDAAADAQQTGDDAKSASEKKRKHKEQRSSKDKAKRKHRHDSPSKKERKKPKLITHDELISGLNVVVDKRVMEQDREKEEIFKALSTEGFTVTPELLEENRDATQAILAQEIPVGNSASILRAANPRNDLSKVLQLYSETVSPPKKPSSSSPGKDPRNDKSYLAGKKPVIVVPKGMSAPITLINAHEFLSNSRYVPRDVMIKQGRQRSPPTLFTRNVRTLNGSGTAPLEYEIMDNPKKLGSDLREWERIVAVLVLGQGWQFKDWSKHYSNPVHLFARTYGFYVSMEGDKLPKELSGWSVRQSQLNRDKRGLDSVTFASFWNGLDEWMGVHKRELLPQGDL